MELNVNVTIKLDEKALKELRAIFNKHSLRSELMDYLDKEAEAEIETHPVIPEKKDKVNKPAVHRVGLTTKSRHCILCGKEFMPVSNAQKKCHKGCYGNQNATYEPKLDIDKVRAEREKEPYVFGK